MDKRYYYGFFFLFVQALAIIRNLLYGYNYFFWFCDFAPIVFSIAFFMGNKNIIKSIINFGLLPQIIFLLDFIYATNKGTSLLGVQVDLLNFSSFTVLSTIFIHLTTIFALLLTLKTKPTKKTFCYSLIFVFIIYFAMLILTSPQGDINYVYSTGDLLDRFNITIPHIVLLWPILVILLLIIPTQIIQYFLYRVFNRKRNSKKSFSLRRHLKNKHHFPNKK